MPEISAYKQLILNNISQLTKNQKKIAQFLIDHPEEIAFSSIDTIADKLKVGKATIVRLAQALGYKGFLELKAELSDRLRDNLTATKKFKDVLDNAPLKSDFVSVIANNEIENIRLTFDKLDRASFDKAVDLCVSASKIYTIGAGISMHLSQLTAYFLNRITLKAAAFTSCGFSFHEQILAIKKEDTIIAISLVPYTLATIEAAEMAHSKGVRVISITDKLVAPIAEFSDVVFPVSSENIVFINTASAILTFVCALATGIGLKDRSHSLEVLSSLEGIKTNFDFDVHTDYFR
ncbi:MAG: MurR/RpiR family transcriptional regulator [Candidatus Zhuqueibacterota bacterium]